MSVINQMLRDLDARGQGNASRRAALLSVGQTSAPRRERRRDARLWWLLAASTIALASVVALRVADRWQAIEAVAVPGPAQAPSPAASVARVETAPAVIDVPVSPAPPAASLVPADGPREPAIVEPAAASAGPATGVAAPLRRPTTPPAAAQETPVARASIERVVPDVDPLDEPRRALSEGRADEALAALAVHIAPSAERDALEAAALQALGRHPEAEQAYRRALQREPDIGAWWAGLGISLDATGRGAEALDAYREAQRRGPLAPALADYLGERVEALSAGEPSR